MSTPARQARQALGARLREIREGAGLSGRGLAGLAGWHYTKVSKVENAVLKAREEDIRTWCRLCEAEDKVADLVAATRSIETMFVEWRKQLRSGTKNRQKESVRFEAETRVFRSFEACLIPGLLQTAAYAEQVLRQWTNFHGTPDDVEAGVAARMERQQILYHGDRRFHLVISESVLTLGVVDQEVLIGQLDRLLAMTELPRVHMGIIPTRASHEYFPLHGFWILDSREVLIETYSAEVKLTQPQEIAVYEKAFERLASSAVYGRSARRLISRALQALAGHEQ
ncbi:helix-turn-helix domain-containing protein [Nonomuraea endophytica]|uniref:Transcriptional regulator with XRE-family HTH domain n=1 Tax=Nonomuraea endophytica TaxID=714136 RepID=A0A7W8A6X2_9ACTN|nr:helix-turn-helix transcriptional regulator [Nonomuraea endophytica]MBB5079835.1 transcriptional regulator with XRE-family HTH domain [Nonomuraea endophytica]